MAGSNFHSLRQPPVGPSPAIRIALVGTTSRMSGVEFSTLYFAKVLQSDAWKPIVVCPEDGDLPSRCRDAGIEVAFVPLSRSFGTSVRFAGRTVVNPLGFLGNLVSLLINSTRLKRFLRQQRIGLLVTKGMHAHFFAGVAARMEGIPCVWHVQDRVSERYGPVFKWILSGAGRLLADRCIADAESIARQLRTFIPKNRISVIWNGVDTNRFSPDVDGSSVRNEWGVDRDGMLVGVIARLTPWKGQHLLLEACAGLLERHPKLRVVFVGTPMFDDNRYLEHLHRYVETHGLERFVRFAGFRWDVPEVLAALDVVVHTSTEKDSSPLAVVSAMAAGKPIVCSRVDGTAELFDDGRDALLFTPGDAGMLQRSLDRVLSDASLAARLGRSAREKAVKELSLDLFAQRCEVVLREALR